jgi:hypothetical protein
LRLWEHDRRQCNIINNIGGNACLHAKTDETQALTLLANSAAKVSEF